MRHEAQPIDVSHSPELLSFAREVKRSGTPRLLCADGEELVRVSPVKPRRSTSKGKPTFAGDPFWRIIAMGQVGEPGDDASERVDELLADFESGNQA
jgi:hypothetical protein